uniref:Leucine rich colipase like 1 n=1 Tax=Sus scrofa TaxID=9823 RepID=A0A4X1UJS1_PIG
GRVMVSPGLLLLLLLLLLPCMLPLASLHTWKTGCPVRSAGNARAAVTNSLSPEKFCTPQTVLQKCLLSLQPNGYMCSRHSECQSNCCITNNYGKLLFCTARTIFLQCVPWRKPNWDYCTYHSECQSKCCLRLNEVSKHRCVPQTGILVQCLPVVRWGGGGRGMGTRGDGDRGRGMRTEGMGGRDGGRDQGMQARGCGSGDGVGTGDTRQWPETWFTGRGHWCEMWGCGPVL